MFRWLRSTPGPTGESGARLLTRTWTGPRMTVRTKSRTCVWIGKTSPRVPRSWDPCVGGVGGGYLDWIDAAHGGCERTVLACLGLEVVGECEGELLAAFVAVGVGCFDLEVVGAVGEQAGGPGVGEVEAVEAGFSSSVLSGPWRVDRPELVLWLQSFAEVDRGVPGPDGVAAAADAPAETRWCDG